MGRQSNGHNQDFHLGQTVTLHYDFADSGPCWPHPLHDRSTCHQWSGTFIRVFYSCLCALLDFSFAGRMILVVLIHHWVPRPNIWTVPNHVCCMNQTIMRRKDTGQSANSLASQGRETPNSRGLCVVHLKVEKQDELADIFQWPRDILTKHLLSFNYSLSLHYYTYYFVVIVFEWYWV